MANKNGMVIGILVIVGIIIGLQPGGFLTGINLGGGAATDAPPATCADASVAMTIGPLLNRWDSTTSMAGQPGRVFVEGVDQGLILSGATKNVKPGAEVEIYYEGNNTGNTDQYWPTYAKFTVPVSAGECGPFDSASLDGGAHKVVAVDDSITFTSKNDDGFTISQAGTYNQSLGAGDEAIIDLKLESTNEQAFATVRDMYLVIEFDNDTLFKQEQTDLDGWTKTTFPCTYTQDATTNAISVWKKAGQSIEDKRLNEHYDLSVFTEDGQGVDNAMNNSIKYSLYPESYYLATDGSGEMRIGVCNEDQTLVGPVAPNPQVGYASVSA